VPALIILFSLIVGFGRFTVPGHDLSYAGTYEAVAHIWVGMLLMWCFYGRDRALALVSLSAITILETVMFLIR
jgi:hypothetical protein